MNLTKIFKMQKELDKAIMGASNSVYDDVREKRIVALLVEIGEFANEFSPFKYWKKNIIVNEDHLLEEYVDGIHFLTSIALEVGANPIIKPIQASEDKSVQLLEIFNAVAGLKYKYDTQQLDKAYGLYIGMAHMLDISDKQVEDFYIMKNKINYERIANKY